MLLHNASKVYQVLATISGMLMNVSEGFPRSSLIVTTHRCLLQYLIAVFFRCSLTAQNEYFSARPVHVCRGVVHVRAQEMKMKLTKIHIFLCRTKI